MLVFRIMRVSVSPAPAPEVRVAVSGVLVRGLISAMNLKSSPSSAIAQITRGIGNIAPSRLPGRGGRPGYIVSTLTPTRMPWNIHEQETPAHIYREHCTVQFQVTLNKCDMQEEAHMVHTHQPDLKHTMQNFLHKRCI